MLDLSGGIALVGEVLSLTFYVYLSDDMTMLDVCQILSLGISLHLSEG